MMTKNKINFIVDFLSFIAFLIVAKTGLIIFFFLPNGVRRGGYQEFFGITKSTYIDIHNWAGIILVILLAIHFVMHWRWIVYTTKSLFKKATSTETDKK